MDSFTIHIRPQYVKLTEEEERIGGKVCRLHEVQKRMKVDFLSLPEFTIITAPTGTGKSYAFPFPVLQAAQHSIDKVRGLIVLPTNALISELTASFRQTYENLNISQLTGPELDKYDLRGLKRWKKAIEITESSDLVITNPDILNYAMHGGYHKWAGNTNTSMSRFDVFFKKFNFLIFDEYHLYDEAQIANILTLVKLRRFFLQHDIPNEQNYYGIRFLFVSATPEKGLKEIFESEGYEYEEIIEEIVSEPENTRQIHGTLEVEFVSSEEIQSLVTQKIPELHTVLKKQKALVILDQVRKVQELEEELASEFSAYTIYPSTGYVSKRENHKTKIESANLIIATNKAEVGVNYDVDYCIMQPGKFYQNFVQRFGRISRGEQDGKVVVAIENNRLFRKMKKAFDGQADFDYYDFLDIMRERLQGKEFYTKKVPLYLGEYMWCIQNSIRRFQNFDIWRYLKRRMNEEDFFQGRVSQRYFLFQQIDEKIRDLIKTSLNLTHVSKKHEHFEHKDYAKTIKRLEKQDYRTYQWVIWWHKYLDTYLTFRDGSKVVKIFDQVKGEELEYSLDWILQHKIVEQIIIEQTEPYEIVTYVVGSLKDRDRDIQYSVSTIPNAGKNENNYLTYSDLFRLDKVFKKAVLRIKDKVKNGVEKSDFLQLELLGLVDQLVLTFDRKRLSITDIQSDDTIL
ncbi:MAG: type I-D CRISPR-associated helicase Cas3' [Bacteroidota bacterium]